MLFGNAKLLSGSCLTPARLRRVWEAACNQEEGVFRLGLSFVCGIVGLLSGSSFAGDFAVLKTSALAHYVEAFNAHDSELVTNAIPNARAKAWMEKNVPLFECPDAEVEEMYYFRWWSYRKHLVKTPGGFVVTEFLTPVKHAGAFNTISCAAGFHLAEGRWLRDQKPLDDYTRFWFRGNNGKPQPHLHKFSSWLPAAVYDRYLVTGDKRFLTGLLDDLVADYRAWETERQSANGFFWQYDVADAMEESISGSRTNKNLRPTINSYMMANARAIGVTAKLAGKTTLAEEFSTKSATLEKLIRENLWDADAKFFKVKLEDGTLSDAREALGFVPWMFSSGWPQSYSMAWEQLKDPQGFNAPFGITTAERRHPAFRSHGVGTCEWDGAVWPFATSQTLNALANVLRETPSDSVPPLPVSAKDFMEAFLTYTHSQEAGREPYIGEYLDEVTGSWINRNGRSAYYNHSTYADLLITGVVGLRPRDDQRVEVYPLLPASAWDWFCLDGVKYRGRMLTIVWDKDGSRYDCGRGLQILVGGKQIAHADRLERILGKLP